MRLISKVKRTNFLVCALTRGVTCTSRTDVASLPHPSCHGHSCWIQRRRYRNVEYQLQGGTIRRLF